MSERYVRDFFHPSHDQTSLYKGNSSDYVRDERIFELFEKRAPTCLYDWPSRESAGMGPYYRVHHGENELSPKQQDDIMQILAHFCSTEGIKFDHYETDWDFG